MAALKACSLISCSANSFCCRSYSRCALASWLCHLGQTGALLVVLEAEQHLPLGDPVALLHPQVDHLAGGLGEDLHLALGFEVGGEPEHLFDRAAGQGDQLDRHRLVFLVALGVVLLGVLGVGRGALLLHLVGLALRAGAGELGQGEGAPERDEQR